MLPLVEGHSRGLSGLLVINSDEPNTRDGNMRFDILVQQAAEKCSPALIVTRHAAEKFPLVCTDTGDRVSANAASYMRLFDRVLCRAPSSNDGLLRFPLGAPQPKWRPTRGNAIHEEIQVGMALHAFRLLKVSFMSRIESVCQPQPPAPL